MWSFDKHITINGIHYSFNNDAKTVEVTFEKLDGCDVVSNYTGNVVIPKSISYNGKSYSVTSIGIRAFCSCKKLTSVVIPDSVTSIKSRAFESCSSLTNITIPNSVTTIGKRAFYFCRGIKSITIPDSVLTIDEEAFCWCECLSSLYIGKSLSSFGKNSFSYTCLSKIIVSNDNIFFDSRNNCNAIIESRTNTLILGSNGAHIPDSIASIGDKAFFSTSLECLNIPRSVNSVGNYALTTKKVKRINICDLEAWCNINFSSEIIHPNTYNKYDLCINGKPIVDLLVPESVKVIKNYAFSNCNSILKAFIPKSVTRIGDYAFLSCNSLVDVNLPNTIRTIGDGAFSHCAAISNINIPNSVISIGDQAFYKCNGLSSITIPNSVERIGKEAFNDTNLVSAIVPNTVKYMGQSAFESVSCVFLSGIGDYMASASPTVWRVRNSRIIPRNDLGQWGPFCKTSYFCIGKYITSIKKLLIDSDDIFCFATIPPICDDLSFRHLSAKIHVPAELVPAYFIAPHWSNFYNIIGDAVRITGLSITQKSIEVVIGEEFTLNTVISPANANPQKIAWSTSNLRIAKPISNGQIIGKFKAVSTGRCIITAKCLDHVAVCHVLVLKDRIKIEQNLIQVKRNCIVEIPLTLETNKLSDFVVSSSDQTIAAARVMFGKLQIVGINEGKVIISIASSDKTSKPVNCYVTVIN